MKYLLIFVLLFSYNALAQITFNSSDINALYSPGNSTTLFIDTSVTSINIGQLGSTSWDFSSLVNIAEVGTFITVDPASTPYIGSFPGSNIGFKSTDTETTIYGYFSLNNSSFNTHGTVLEFEVQGIPVTLTETLNPIEPTVTFPFTFGSTIDYNGERTVVSDSPFFPDTVVTTVVNKSKVDAYGPMTLPGGRVVDALRIKQDLINIWPDPSPITIRIILYQFLTKDGSVVNVISDTTQPETGIINISGQISWNDAYITSVKVEETIPNDFSLRQNYPNPFNPSTSIEYTIPSESFVELKVFDVLGNEVATLVNEQQQAGVYRADFSADNLPSGMYFARLTANEFTQVVKMILLK